MPAESPQSPTPEILDVWSGLLAERFGLERDAIPVGLVLALAADAAHGVTRPAAPLSTFIAGLVAGSRGLDAAGLEAIVAEIRELAAGWSTTGEESAS